MAWPVDHKAHTRDRILAAAAAALREQGIEAAGVAGIMDRAGLTHGGFYAHFAAKDDLLAYALAQASRESLAPLAAAAVAVPHGQRLRAVLQVYLSPWQLSQVASGCPIAALGPEVARSGGRLQRELGGGVRARLDWLRALLPRARKGRRRQDDAVGALSCMVGGLILGRVLGGEEGQELLAASRRFLERSLSAPPTEAR